MKSFLFTALITLVSIINLNAQELENSTLWKIEGNGLEKASYLFGTIHITCDATIEDDVKKALDETTQVVLEIDMDDPNMQNEMMSGMFMKDDKTLKDYVNDEEYAVIDSLFTKNMGMSVTMVERVKPFFLIAMFYPQMLDCSSQSFETELMKVAQEQGEEVYGLETIQDQIQVFEDIPYEDQVKDLLKTAKDNLEADKALFIKMLKIYADEDIDALLDMMDDDTSSSMSKHQDKLLVDRNTKWIPRIGKYAKEQPTFFGVGAGHLAGEDGVIKLLREAGYTVTAVVE